MSIQKEQPTNPMPDTYKPSAAREYTVSENDSWATLAQDLHMEPWDLIDFNFPGMKPLVRIDAQRACRQVNWYLFEYVGCEKSTDKYNYAFSSGITRGRGVHKGGKLFLPLFDAARDYKTIDIPSDIDSPGLAATRAKLSTTARELQPVELAFAKLWYSNSLVYEDIYVSDAEGVGGRPFTIALPLKKRWIVVLNLGPKGFNDPVAFNKATLIHELAHAWQSQHHPDPWQFMVNSVLCRRAAAIGTLWTATQWRDFHEARATKLDQKEFIYRNQASANAWFPGRRFGQYGGEQIAQQVQDFFFPPVGYYVRPPTHGEIWQHMKKAPPGKPDPDNVRSLEKISYEYRRPEIVWHSP
jgi:hypothetical protein